MDEVCNNAIEHGNKKGAPSDAVKLLCNLETGKLELTVIDRGGEGFNLEKALRQNKQLMERKAIEDNPNKRGRGLIIVQRFVDTLDVDTNEGGTTVRMVKRAKKD